MLRIMLQRTWTSTAARALLLGLAYLAGAELGHALSFKDHDQALATFWPPSGILVAALVLSGWRSWPAMLLAAAVANLASNVLLHDRPLLVSMGFLVADGVEACVGAWGLRRLVGLSPALRRMNDVLGLVAWSALLSTMVGATLGAAVVKLAFREPSYWSVWRLWWTADALGVFVLAPVVFTWATDGVTLFQDFRPRRLVEMAALFVGMVLAAVCVYAELLPGPPLLPMFILPFLLWAAVRFEPRTAATAVLVVAIIGVWNTSQGRGPYTMRSALPEQQMVRVQGALAVISLSVLLLAAAVAERRQAEQERTALIAKLQQALREIKTLRGLIPMCAWCKKIRDDAGFWQQVDEYLRRHTEAEVSHGICPECLERQFASLLRQDGGKGS